MKREYTKPFVVFESFSMSTNIAGDCETPYVNNIAKGTCAVLGTGGIAVFNSSVGAACKYTPVQMGGSSMDEYNGLCYYNPTEYNNLFNS